jgi:hypothetical protein
LRVQALLDLSKAVTNGMYVSMFVLLIAGVAAAFIAGLWGTCVDLAAIILLVLMYAYDVRARLDLVPRSAPLGRSGVCDGEGRAASGAAYAARLATLTASSRPMEIAAIGYRGLILSLRLMVVKPF